MEIKQVGYSDGVPFIPSDKQNILETYYQSITQENKTENVDKQPDSDLKGGAL